jgi:uncharacterized protein
MKISMYEASVPCLIRSLDNLANILDRAQAFADAKKVDTAVLAGSRLYPDMLPMARQIMIATDTAKGAAARLAGVEVPKYDDTEQTIAELKARVAKTVAFLRSVSAAQIDGSEDRDIVLKLGGNEARFTGLSYLLEFVLPNFYFHVTTAYAILRHNGVEIGKKDYLGNR